VVTGWAVPASAQVPTPTTSQEQGAIDRCIEERIEAGTAPPAATRGCVPDTEQFDTCMDEQVRADPSVRRALQVCLADQFEAPVDTSTTRSEEQTSTTGARDGQDRAAGPTTASGSSDGSGGAGPVAFAGVGLGGAAVGAAVVFLTSRSRTRSSADRPSPGPTERSEDVGAGHGTAAPAAPVPDSPTVEPPTATGSDSDRLALVHALVELGDLVTSDALRTTIAERLAAAGVVPVWVDAGTRFDPTTHRGVQAEPATSPIQDGIVASCDRVGWSDRGTLMRPPEVVVYRWEPT